MRALLLPAIFLISALDQVRCAPTTSVKSVYSLMPTYAKVRFDLFHRKEPFNRERMSANLRSLPRDQIEYLFYEATCQGREEPFKVLLTYNYEDAEDLACEALERAVNWDSYWGTYYLVSIKPRSPRITPECFRRYFDQALEASKFNAIEGLVHYSGPAMLTTHDVYQLFEKKCDNSFITDDRQITPTMVRRVFDLAQERDDDAMLEKIVTLGMDENFIISPAVVHRLFQRGMASGNVSKSFTESVYLRVIADAARTGNIAGVIEAMNQFDAMPLRDHGMSVAILTIMNFPMKNKMNILRAALEWASSHNYAINGLLLGNCLLASDAYKSMETVDFILHSFRIHRAGLIHAFVNAQSYELLQRLLNPQPEDQSRLTFKELEEILLESRLTENHVRALTNPQNQIQPSRYLIEWAMRQNPGNWPLRRLLRPDLPVTTHELTFEELNNFQAVRPEEERDSKCAICLQEYQENPTEMIVKLPCNHCFHKECLHQAHGATCPNCRREF